jgi:hypothetical protein
MKGRINEDSFFGELQIDQFLSMTLLPFSRFNTHSPSRQIKKWEFALPEPPPSRR